MRVFLTTLTIVLCSFRSPASAQVFDERFDDWPLHTFIRGTVAIADTLEDTDILTSMFPADSGRIRIIAEHPDEDWIQHFETAEDSADVTIAKDDEETVSRLSDLLKTADVLFWKRSAPLSPAERKAAAKAADAVSEFLNRDGTLVLIGRHSAVVSRLYQATPDGGVTADGLNLIPDSVIGFSAAGKKNPDPVQKAVRQNPRTFGISLSPDALLVLKGRKFRVFGEGGAVFRLPKSEALPVRTQNLKMQTSRRQDPNEYLVDLTEWRREAIERTLEPFPPAKPKKPHVENGTLVIVGGGGMPKGLMDRFIELAGGKENARLVYVPCAEQEELSARQGTVEAWKRAGVQHATFIHTKNRDTANNDEDFLEPLKDATGIWFGGGRQWNFADSYYGTTAQKLMKDVLKRGGVIGGSSAGASVQARYLARATPIRNFRIMAPGYERGGLGFISGVAIDQHFSQRGRQKDMTQLVNRYPQMLGIGIDEATALIVRGSVGEIEGRGQVFFYDRTQPVIDGEPDYVSLPAGSSYHLADRKILKDAGADEKPKDEEDKPAAQPAP